MDVSSYQGQAVELSFVATTDSYLNSNFFLDDVSLSATGAGARTPPGAMSHLPARWRTQQCPGRRDEASPVHLTKPRS